MAAVRIPRNRPGDADGADFPVVIGIPVPIEAQTLARTPPICPPSMGDVLAVELIRSYGAVRKKSDEEITQACSLASGLSDVVIILERPRATTYDTTFDQFIDNSGTLSAVDSLIRFASKGARSIHTVSVVDAFSFQEDKSKKQYDADCHFLLAQIIRTKKPRVIIRCHRDSYEDEWMQRFELSGEEYQLQRKTVVCDNEHMTVVFQSFHPSCAIHNVDYRPEYRALLIHHFIAAFGELRGEGQLPECAEDLRKLCVVKGHRINPPSITARDITVDFCTKYTYPKPHFVGIVDLSRRNRLRYQARARYEMYCCLERLVQGKYPPGSLAIGRTYMFSWKNFYGDEPLYQQVSWLLRAAGAEQQSWIVPTPIPKPHVDPLIPILLDSPTSGDTDISDGDLVECRSKLVIQIRRRRGEIGECLRASRGTEMAASLRLAGLVAYGGMIQKALEEDVFLSQDGRDRLKADTEFCHEYLRALEGCDERSGSR
jgi:hypothetical protein